MEVVGCFFFFGVSRCSLDCGVGGRCSEECLRGRHRYCDINFVDWIDFWRGSIGSDGGVEVTYCHMFLYSTGAKHEHCVSKHGG
jgi:hypothetical protein